MIITISGNLNGRTSRILDILQNHVPPKVNGRFRRVILAVCNPGVDPMFFQIHPGERAFVEPVISLHDYCLPADKKREILDLLDQ